MVQKEGRMGSERLTAKQIKWAHAYYKNGGNGVGAARDAGYSGNTNVLNSISLGNKKNSRVMALVEKLENGMEYSDAAGKEDIMVWWTLVMNDEVAGMKSGDRLKASEYLAKANRMFVEQKEVKTESRSVLAIPKMTPEEWEKFYQKDILEEEN